ncbi:MAG: LacI family DNA-binding transcriptional regulator [Phycisphaerae bacterium]
MAVTICDIAKVVKTTDATVSMALRNNPRISLATRQKVHDAAKTLGYHPNHLGRSFQSGKTQTIGLIIPDFFNPFYVEFLKGAQAVCLSHGYQLITIEYCLDINQERACLEQMLGRRCDGIITMPSRFDPVKDLIEKFWGARIPCVVIGLPFDMTEGIKIDGVRIDITPGMEAAIDHLVTLGHRDILLAASWPKECGGGGRYDVFEQVLRKNNLPFDPQKNIYYHFTGDQHEDGRQMGRDILKKYPRTTAIIGANDHLIIGMMQSLMEIGVRVPEDLSLIGTDNTRNGQNWVVPLTSIDQRATDQARAATELLFERMKSENWAEPKHITWNAGLVVRKSTGPVRAV